MTLEELAAKQRAGLLGDGKRSSVGRGAEIYGPGDSAATIYVAEVGRVKLVRASFGGSESIVGIHNPGEFFGELEWLAGDRERAGSAVALDPGEIWAIPATAFERRLGADAAFAAAFARGASRRLTALEREMTELAGKSVPGRLVDLLGRLAVDHGIDEAGGTVRIDVSLTHQDLADLIGTSRETLTKELSVLADVGLLRVSPRCVTLLQPRAFPFSRRRE